jgi:uncharacterized protein (TIGR02145 family)
VVHAQSVDVCSDALPYTIASTVDASGASTYQWLENGQIIYNASAPAYVVPGGKAAGQYTYIRQAKSADCSEWQSSNEFVVTVFNCSFSAGTETGATATFVDPRDGKRYKTVVMPDNKTWFAQNLNYTKDLTYNAYSYEANGKQFTSFENGVPAIGSYWCPPAYYVPSVPSVLSSMVSGNQSACDVYGALYTWETVMMMDGKYADETKTSSAWDESWVSPYYYTGASDADINTDKNNARGGTNVKGGGRGICPMGWHVPTKKEWDNLLDKVEGDGTGNLFSSNSFAESQIFGNDVGTKLKFSSTYTAANPYDGSWYTDGLPIDIDLIGFNVKATGYISVWTNNYKEPGSSSVMWSASSVNASKGTGYQLTYNTPGAAVFTEFRTLRSSVRCVLD